MKFRRESALLSLLIVVGVLAALWGAKARFSVEQRDKRTEIVVDYNDALNLSLAARRPLPDVLNQLKAAGVTSLALWEDAVDNLRLEGAMTVHAVDPNHTELAFSDSFPGEQQRVVAALRHKTSVPFKVRRDELIVNAPYNQISGVGIGLEPAQVVSAVKHGFLISPRLYNYSGATPTAIQWMLDQVKTQCGGNANVVIFNGGDVLGNRGDIDATANALRADGLLYGSLEFGKQIGDDTLSRLGSDLTIRVHSIGGNEMPNMDEPTAVGRFALAAREREIRSCYVRLFQNGVIGEPDILTANLDYLRDIVRGLHDGGITVGRAHPFETDPRPKRLLLALMGVGVAAAGVRLLRQFLPVTGAIFWPVLIVTLAAGAFLATRESTMTGRQAAALVAAMTFPTLGLILRRPPRNARVARSGFWALERAFRTYEMMTLLTICGIVMIVGLLADRLMLIKVYEFVGIRLAIITPLLLLLLHEGLGFHELPQAASWEQRRTMAARRWRQITSSPLLMGQVMFGFVMLALVGLIVLRSGNDPGVGVSSSELSFRALLNKVLYVRPRTKEIFFGFPLLTLGLALYYSGKRRWYLLFACAGAIAQADLLNTFCHIHTPLLISTIRAMLGWLIGLAGGVVLFLITRRFGLAGRGMRRRYDAGDDTQIEDDAAPAYGDRQPVSASQ